MYSDKLREKFREKDIEIGDRIKAGNKEGVLMPKPKTGDPDVIVLSSTMDII